MAFPVCAPGRLPRLPFRGLLGLHSRCGLQACSTSFRGLLSLGFESGSHLPSPPDSYRGGRLPPRAGLPPAGQVHLHGARTLRAHEETEGKEKPSNPVRLLGFSGWRRRESNPPLQTSGERDPSRSNFQARHSQRGLGGGSVGTHRSPYAPREAAVQGRWVNRPIGTRYGVSMNRAGLDLPVSVRSILPHESPLHASGRSPRPAPRGLRPLPCAARTSGIRSQLSRVERRRFHGRRGVPGERLWARCELCVQNREHAEPVQERHGGAAGARR